MTKFANNEEIRYAHSLLLDGKPFFDQQKIDIIECDESRDVKACPGSGKTTTLLAKLVILANKMPLPNNQGVCVLTHTNVAIDEIKSKLGSKANILFSYPNHFGTIQSFVDKYIGNLSMQYYYDTSIRVVDDELADKMMISHFCSLDKVHNKLHTKLYGQLIGGLTEFSEQQVFSIGDKNTLLKLKVISLIPKARKDKYKFNMSGYTKANLRLAINNEQVITNIYNTKSRIDASVQEMKISSISNSYIDFVEKKVVFPGGSVGLDTESGVEFLKIKENLFKQGIIKYGEAYDLAMRLCAEHRDILQQAISSRFKYLFIDEMQDTDDRQLLLIRNLFNNTIVQCYGDHHQSIYNSVKKESFWIPNNPYPLDMSIRFGEAIAKVLRSVCIEDNKNLMANASIKSVKPIIIIYDNPLSVIPRFIEILKDRKIEGESILDIAQREKRADKLHRNNIKAIGWVGSDNEKVTTIRSYFPLFNKNIRKNDKVNYESFASFIRRKDNGTVKDYIDSILSAILYILSLTETSKVEIKGQKKNYTKTTFWEKYRQYSIDEYNDAQCLMTEWAKRIHNTCDCNYDAILTDIKTYIINKLAPIFTFDPHNAAIQSFIENTACVATDAEIKTNNTYVNDEVEIDINTIHSIKGETHAATLYLETSYRNKCESQRIAEQLKGIANSDDSEIHIQTLKMAYVGMSRPRYLLCMAISRSNFIFDCEELRRLWDIEDVVNDAEWQA